MRIQKLRDRLVHYRIIDLFDILMLVKNDLNNQLNYLTSTQSRREKKNIHQIIALKEIFKIRQVRTEQ